MNYRFFEAAYIDARGWACRKSAAEFAVFGVTSGPRYTLIERFEICNGRIGRAAAPSRTLQ